MAECLHTHLARSDPTRTVTLQRRFEGEVGRRFRDLKGAIREALVERDVLGLQAPRPVAMRDKNLVPPARAFDFPRSSDKIAAFMEWLDEAQAAEVLDVRQGVPVGRAAEQAWTKTYISAAYAKGVQHAARKMRGEGADVSDRWVDAALSRGTHADRAGIAYTRAFQELRGITEAMDQQISRELAQGLAEGLNPRDIARRINDRVDRVGITRARMLARTEVINAHAEASLNAYEEAGAEGVDVEAEWITATDPCPECEALAADAPYTISEARGLIPRHPNCRCAWAPRLKNPRRVELR